MSEEAAITQMIQEWCAGTNQPGEAGADAYASFGTEDVVLLPPNAERLDGRDAVRAWMLEFSESDEWSITWGANRIEVSPCGELAYAVGTYELSVKDADGNTVADRGKFLDALRKEDGRWKAAAVSFNSDLAAE